MRACRKLTRLTIAVAGISRMTLRCTVRAAAAHPNTLLTLRLCVHLCPPPLQLYYRALKTN